MGKGWSWGRAREPQRLMERKQRVRVDGTKEGSRYEIHVGRLNFPEPWGPTGGLQTRVTAMCLRRSETAVNWLGSENSL
jgi:hypothetical protein